MQLAISSRSYVCLINLFISDNWHHPNKISQRVFCNHNNELHNTRTRCILAKHDLLGLEEEIVERINIDIACSWCTGQETSPLPTTAVVLIHAKLDTSFLSAPVVWMRRVALTRVSEATKMLLKAGSIEASYSYLFYYSKSFTEYT